MEKGYARELMKYVKLNDRMEISGDAVKPNSPEAEFMRAVDRIITSINQKVVVFFGDHGGDEQ